MSKKNQEYWLLLEQLRWQGQPRCPYCDSTQSAALKKEQRYHCNECFTSYSVTVGTLFHKSRLDLSKWFRAIELLQAGTKPISVRKLAAEIKVSKNTAEYMISRIRTAKEQKDKLLDQIAHKIAKNQNYFLDT